MASPETAASLSARNLLLLEASKILTDQGHQLHDPNKEDLISDTQFLIPEGLKTAQQVADWLANPNPGGGAPKPNATVQADTVEKHGDNTPHLTLLMTTKLSI